MTTGDPAHLDWQRIEDIFHHAAALPTEQRSPFLDAQCADAPEIRAEVVSLLAASDAPTDRVDGAIHGTMEAWLDAQQAAVQEHPFEELGPYRILRRLSEGGQAVVYLAERQKPYRQQVAIKLLKRGMDTDEILRRLHLERQILAQLAHPNIARLLDGGSSPDGRPYFALEYIDGEPIDRFCDRRRLTVAERLILFRRACTPVQLAHNRLIIHRDLKPSNLLVTRDGEPKLLDFGIAKLLDTTELDATAARTRTGYRWLTPSYAAPEQVLGHPLTTAVDVYALGVLLYLLLTGELPKTFESQAPSHLEKELEKRVEPPSSRVARSGREQTAQSRGTTLERLKKALKGDLDTIVGKALHGEPDRRYASVQQMAEDIDRYLGSKPVLARNDTWTYRWSKFVRRNRVGVGAVGLVFLTLLGGVIGTTRALRFAEAQRQLAEQRLDAVEAVMGFTTDMFQIADPGESRGNQVTVREILDLRAGRIDEELGDRQPAVAARLMTTVASVYHNLGIYQPSADLLETAAERWQSQGGDHGPELLDSRRRLVAVKIDQGKFQEAELHLRRLADFERELLPAEDPSRATTLHLSGLVTRRLRGNADAEPLLRQALGQRLQSHGEMHLDVAESLNDLGQVLFALDRLPEAQELLERSLAIRLNLLGAMDPKVAETRHNLATVLQGSKQWAEAEAQHRDVLEIRRRLLGEEHRDVAVSLNNLGRTLCSQDRHSEAEQALRQARLIVDQNLPKNPLRASVLSNLALELKDLGRPEEALELMSEALDVHVEIFGARSPEVARAQFNLAVLLRAQGESDAAERLLQQNIRLMEALEIRDGRLAYPLTLLAELLAQNGKCSEARPFIERASELRAHLPKDDSRSRRTAEVSALCPR